MIYDRQAILPLSLNFIVKDIEVSSISLVEIFSFIKNQKEKMISFAPYLFENKKSETIGPGICIKIAIYILLFETKGENEFRAYLKRIKMPRKIAEGLIGRLGEWYKMQSL